MPAITIADLENAKLDVDHIAAVATSTAPTVTDRLGGVKKTMAGASADVIAKVAEVEAARNTAINVSIPAAVALVDTAVAETAAGSASASAAQAAAARDAAYVNADVYASTAAGLAAVALGEQFQVVSADGLTLIRYRHDAGPIATPVGVPYPSANYVSDTRNRLEGLFTADPDDYTPLMGVQTLGGDMQVAVGYRTSSGELEVNGDVVMTEVTFNANLEPKFENVLSAPTSSVLPLAGVPSASGDMQVVVSYNTETNSLQVNGADLPSPEELSSAVAASTVSKAKATLVPIATADKPTFAQVSHLMTYGQSLSNGVNSTPVYSASQPYNNLTFTQGPRSTKSGSVGELPGMDTLVPLVENLLYGDGIVIAHGETPCSGWANGLVKRQAIEDGTDWRTSGKQYLATANGKGSAGINNLLPGGSTALGEWYQVVRDAIAQGHALSTAAGKSYSLPVVAYMQGEGDNADGALAGGVWGTKLGTLHAAIEATYHGVTGTTDRVWLGVYQTYARSRSQRPHATIDQLDYAESVSNAFLVTPIYHLSTAYDGHLSALGSYWFGQYLAKKTKVLADGFNPQWLKKPKATVSGSVVRLHFPLVPVAPLRLIDDGHLKPTTNYGFAVRDSTVTTVGSSLAISSIEITAAGNEVLLTLAAPPSGAVTVRYGLDYLPTGNFDYSGSAGGQLVDSDPDSFVWPVNGLSYPLYNTCPHFDIPAIPV
jgi:hypothetical protein